VTLQQNLAERPGQNVMVAKKVSHAYGGTSILSDVTITIHRGRHIGIIGPNGCGKTTLLQILLGLLPPQQGEVKHGTRLKIAYFDQHRLHIDPERTVQANLCGDEDFIVTPSGRRHAIGYLRDFLFSPDTVRQPAGSLSGGERNRLMLAKLFARPSNVLVLDCPVRRGHGRHRDLRKLSDGGVAPVDNALDVQQSAGDAGRTEADVHPDSLQGAR
jgi:ABC transport system ATP-binding/permease protein